jgi:hypothetical protein
MSTKYLIIGLGLALVALIALSRCGSSEAPVKTDIEPKKAAVAGSFTAAQTTPQTTPAADEGAVATAERSVPVATAPLPPGSPAFGPSTLPPGSGADPAGDEWLKQQRELRAKQDAANPAATPRPDQKNNH